MKLTTGRSKLMGSGAAVRQQPRFDVFVSNTPCPFIPWAAIRMRPFQDFEIASFSCCLTCPCIPWAAISTGPFQYFKMAP